MHIYITEAIAKKLRERHDVSEHQVAECFQNLKSKFAYDTRPEHQTDPPTLWFVGETDGGRRLKIVFVRYSKTEVVIKSAYEPNADEVQLYEMYKQKG